MWDGQVHYTHAHAFWDAVMGYGYRENNLRALVIDLLQGAPRNALLSIRLCDDDKAIVYQDRLRTDVASFLAIYILKKLMILPRQARDKHRENSKESGN
jgi:hypothetical protein